MQQNTFTYVTKGRPFGRRYNKPGAPLEFVPGLSQVKIVLIRILHELWTGAPACE